MGHAALSLALLLSLGKPPAKPAAELDRVDACRQRFAAICEVMHRCSTGAEDLGGPHCEAIDPGCDALAGRPRVSKETVDACLAGLKRLVCKFRVDPSEAEQLEDQVPACAALHAGDAPPRKPKHR